jgi:hypothetical protein
MKPVALTFQVCLMLSLPGCMQPDLFNLPFHLDADKAFHLGLGRGDGRRGLEVITIEQNAQVLLSRLTGTRDAPIWQKAEMQLSAELLRQVVAEVNAEHLTGMAKTYTSTLADGTQWVLLITQGNRRKVIYFDNHFPSGITRFSKSLDEILDKGGRQHVTWQNGGQELDKELWNAVHNR